MKVPVKWLGEYVDIKVSPKQFADDMTMSGSKVEGVKYLGEGISGVVVGKILSLEKHPDADKLQVSKVDTGNGTVQIVTGATNVKVGDYIPVALNGATLPGNKKINSGKLRGVESEGMMCSIQELGYTRYDFPDALEHGIYILPPELPIMNEMNRGAITGVDIKEALGLDEHVVDFEITPNRPDCLSIVGMAREAAATFGVGLRKPDTTVKESGGKASDYASVEIKTPELCPRYAARIIKNVKIGPSPEWMKQRLRAAGVRPINNIVDITNYVMLETGQPMHAFDLDCLKGSKIVVRRADKGEVMETLDGQVRILEPDMLVIADAARPVAVAGVMGGADSEVSESTTSILFESANFNGTSVRIAGKKLGLRTEASMRFEKGLDANNVVDALDRAARLIAELGVGEVVSGIIDCYPVKSRPRTLEFNPERINIYLGTNISKENMAGILRSIELGVDEAGGSVTVPTFRYDIEEMADLAEEIARFYGYNNITPSLLQGKQATIGGKSFKQQVEDDIRKVMFASGLSEIYTYSFTSPAVFDAINLAYDSALRNAVVISNPLGEEQSIMRTTTIPDMLNVLARNYNRRMEEARLFEVSHTYMPGKHKASQIAGIDESGLPLEIETLTLGMYGGVDFYDIKGAVEELLDSLRIKNHEFMPENNPAFHPGRTAALLINGQKAGTVGEIHPDVAEKFSITTRVYVGIIEVEKLIENSSADMKYRPLPRYPAVSRDMAMLVKENVMVKGIEVIIRKNSGKLLEEVKLFDVYKGRQVPEGMKSVAYSLTFRAEDRTLTDEDVNAVFAKIVDGLKEELGAQLREQ